LSTIVPSGTARERHDVVQLCEQDPRVEAQIQLRQCRQPVAERCRAQHVLVDVEAEERHPRVPRRHVPDPAEAFRRLPQVGEQHVLDARTEAHVGAPDDHGGQPGHGAAGLPRRFGLRVDGPGLPDHPEFLGPVGQVGPLAVNEDRGPYVVPGGRPQVGQLLDGERRELWERRLDPEVVVCVDDRDVYGHLELLMIHTAVAMLGSGPPAPPPGPVGRYSGWRPADARAGRRT
jgi:hypothetical protein